MSVATNAIAALGLKRRAFSLGAVKAFDQLMQFLLPVVLVRCLDAATFGEYRLLWLAAGTVMALAPLGVPAVLFYFLPRSDVLTRRHHVQQAVLFLAITGAVGGLAMSPLNPWLPPTLMPLEHQHGLLVAAFIGLWVLASLLDYLPTVDERIGVQAFVTLSTSVARTLLLAAGAWLTGDLAVLLWLLLAVVLFKLVLLLGYVGRFHGWHRPWLHRASLAAQLRYGAPFGVCGALYMLRGQADQWVAASLFALHSFAAFSIAAIVQQVVGIFRASVVQAFFPSMSRLEAAGDMPSAMEMNARANEMVGWVLYPALAFLFAFAGDIVSLVYTQVYADAAPVMRVYVVGIVVVVVELFTVMQLLRQGVFNAGLYASMLCISVLVSWIAGTYLGLAGAAAGSVLALYLDRLLMLRRIAALTGIPVRRQQHWARLAQLLATSALAGALAFAVVHVWLPEAAHAARMFVGALVLGSVYAAATYRRYIAATLR